MCPSAKLLGRETGCDQHVRRTCTTMFSIVSAKLSKEFVEEVERMICYSDNILVIFAAFGVGEKRNACCIKSLGLNKQQ